MIVTLNAGGDYVVTHSRQTSRIPGGSIIDFFVYLVI